MHIFKRMAKEHLKSKAEGIYPHRWSLGFLKDILHIIRNSKNADLSLGIPSNCPYCQFGHMPHAVLFSLLDSMKTGRLF